jgi:cyclic pyranopterin phosphate synthase
MSNASNTAFSHLDGQDRPHMVDVGGKADTERTAIAESRVFLPAAVRNCMSGEELVTKKGAVFQTAIIAGIMAAKKTPELIPLCHTLLLDHCSVTVKLEGEEAVIRCTVKTHGKTGVEMEALTGASVAALTVYDMCKALSMEMVIRDTKLIVKTGGKRDHNAS